jgi:uncharacterized membrane protein YkvA (DUF1232 family)
MTWLLRIAGIAAAVVISRGLQETNRAASERMAALSTPDKLSLLLKLVRDTRTPFWLRGLLLLPAAYVLSPIDLIPDFVPFLGNLDDVAVFGLVAGFVARFTPAGVLDAYLDELSPRHRSRSG